MKTIISCVIITLLFLGMYSFRSYETKKGLSKETTEISKTNFEIGDTVKVKKEKVKAEKECKKEVKKAEAEAAEEAMEEEEIEEAVEEEEVEEVEEEMIEDEEE